MGTIRQMLNQNMLLGIGLILYIASDLGVPGLSSIEALKLLGAWLIAMAAGIAIFNRFTRPD